jgi:hypothetical protein
MFRSLVATVFAPALRAALGSLALGSLAFLASCGEAPLDVDDLTAAEREFVTRYVVLERARAVAMAEPVTGTALLDSLAIAWGDSANAVARGQVPAEPARAAAVYDLLGRLLAAESDSLLRAPQARRLTAPLPSGAAPGPATPALPDEDG